MQKVEKKGDSKGWNDSKGSTIGKGWLEGKGGNTSGKGWEQQRPAGMNNFERDSKQYDVLVMSTSTQEKTVRDSDWCVPVKHVAKLSRMRGTLFQPDRCRHQFLREGEYGLVGASTKHLGAVAEASGCRFRSW